MEQDQKSNLFMKGFFWGSIAGAAVALLFAPKSGKEIRDDLRQRSNEFLDEADTAVKDVRKRAEQVLNDGREKADVLLREAEEKLAEARKKASEILERNAAENNGESEPEAASPEDTAEVAEEVIVTAKPKRTKKSV
jgi:gas vesicle protein